MTEYISTSTFSTLRFNRNFRWQLTASLHLHQHQLMHPSTSFHLSTETSLLDTLYVRSRAQHRSQLFLRNLVQVRRLARAVAKSLQPSQAQQSLPQSQPPSQRVSGTNTPVSGASTPVPRAQDPHLAELVRKVRPQRTPTQLTVHSSSPPSSSQAQRPAACSSCTTLFLSRPF
jgi:hypothetical protein